MVQHSIEIEVHFPHATTQASATIRVDIERGSDASSDCLVGVVKRIKAMADEMERG